MEQSMAQRYMHVSPAAIEGAIGLLDQCKPAHRSGDACLAFKVLVWLLSWSHHANSMAGSPRGRPSRVAPRPVFQLTVADEPRSYTVR